MPVKRFELERLSISIQQEQTWLDRSLCVSINRQISEIEPVVKTADRLLDDVACLAELASLGDQSMQEQIDAECTKLEAEIACLVPTPAATAGPDDHKAAFLSIKAGSGGREACNWAEMLLRMYAKRTAKLGLKAEFVDFSPNYPDGIKTVILRIEGDHAFGRLKDESGIHRLSRVSPFDQADRRQTSFAAIEVVPEAIKTEVDIMPEEDLDIWTCCGGGKGGQNVNKRETVIMIHHLPTGLRVRCQNERTQEANRKIALQVMLSKLVNLKESEQRQEAKDRRVEMPRAAFGNEYRRTYVLSQKPLIIDHFTKKKTVDTKKVMNGELDLLA